jgi:hypothetical protein
VGLAIAHVENSAIVNQHAMWPRKRAPKRIWFRTIAALTRAQNRLDDACLEIDLADDMTFGVRNV